MDQADPERDLVAERLLLRRRASVMARGWITARHRGAVIFVDRGFWIALVQYYEDYIMRVYPELRDIDIRDDYPIPQN